MSYIDGFVVAVPADKKETYIEYSKACAEIFKEFGALSLVESWGDDVPDGESTSFIKAVKCLENEVVCFSWVRWPSKEARDIGMEKVMSDQRLSNDQMPMPFDGKRMIFGGFEIIVDV